MKIKEKLKRNPIIVNLYEVVFGKLHRTRQHILRECKRIKNKLTIKTHFCYGDRNKDKTFFVISPHMEEMGIYSTIFYILPFIDYAIKKKYIPVIDLPSTFLLGIQEEDRKENPWEYYYEQPIKQYTLEEVYQSRHVIVMADSVFKVKMPAWTNMFPADGKDMRYWNQIISSYIRLNHELEDRVETERKRIFKENRRVLGVGIRAGLRAGSMRNETLYNNHPKQPSCEELIDIVEEKIKEWNCDSIFLSCDDREYWNKFVAHFGNKCHYTKRTLRHYFENDKPTGMDKLRIEFAGTTSKERNKEYIVEVYLLAQCQCLYSCKGGGAEFAHFLNGGKYEHIEVYDKGFYTGLGNVKKDSGEI